MGLSYSDAVEQATAAGSTWELTNLEVDGVVHRAFRNAPPTLRDLFDSTRSRGDATFLVYEDERWGFDRFMSEVDAVAALLVDRYDVAHGDRVAIAMRNYPEWIVAFAAITSIGAVSVSFNAWWTADEMTFALEDSSAMLLVADAERVERSVDVCAALRVRVLGVRLGVDAAPEGVDRWEEVVRPGAAMPPMVVDPEDLVTILYTSGTTGRPKGAVSTHRAVMQALMGFGCRAAVQRLRSPSTYNPGRATVFILIVPLFHVTGAVPVMLSCAASGLELVMMYKWDAARALELIDRERVTNFVGVPTQSWDLLECDRFDEYDTSSLVSIGGGGAPAPPELVRRVASSFRGGSPSIGYGMTETNAYGPQNTGPDYLEHPTSTGRATPILAIDIRDEAGSSLPVGESGEIWFSGPNLISGYWNRPDATAETIVDGWLRTGDIGRVDGEGFVYVEDRAKDMVLRGGENVFCAEVEAAIYEHPSVYEAAVFGVPHQRLGEEVAVVIVVRAGCVLDVGELQAHVTDRLASFKVPTLVVLRDDPIPRNASGKMMKRELRDSLGGSDLSGSA